MDDKGESFAFLTREVWTILEEAVAHVWVTMVKEEENKEATL